MLGVDDRMVALAAVPMTTVALSRVVMLGVVMAKPIVAAMLRAFQAVVGMGYGYGGNGQLPIVAMSMVTMPPCLKLWWFGLWWLQLRCV